MKYKITYNDSVIIEAENEMEVTKEFYDKYKTAGITLIEELDKANKIME